MASPCLNCVWDPLATEANEYLAVQWNFVDTITSLNYRQARLSGVYIQGCGDLTSVTFPNCTSIAGYGNGNFLSSEAIQIGFNDLLTTISFSALTYVRGGFWFTDLNALTSLDLSSLVEIDHRIPSGGDSSALLRNASSITSVDLSALTTITTSSTPTASWLLEIYSCSALTDIQIPNLVFPNGGKFDLGDNALSQSCVDAILARAVANAGYVSGRIDLNGGTNAAPSVAGAADKATLIGRGVTVTTN